MKKLIALTYFLTSLTFATSDYVIADVSKQPDYGTAGVYITLKSTHYISVTNPTNKVYGFRYTYLLCAQDKDCEEKSFTMNLQPHQNYQERYPFERKVIYRNPGDKDIYAITRIVGDIREHSIDKMAANKAYIR